MKIDEGPGSSPESSGAADVPGGGQTDSPAPYSRARDNDPGAQNGPTADDVWGFASGIEPAPSPSPTAFPDGDTRYRQMFEKNLAIKLLIDPTTGAIIDANPAAVQFYGYDLARLRSMSIYDINMLSTEEVQQEMARADSESRNYFNFRHRLASGEVRDVEVYSSPIDLGNKHLLYSIVHDITERRRAEAQIRNSLSMFRATVESTADGILVVDREGKIASYNRKFAQMWGVPDLVLAGGENAQLLEFTQTRLKAPKAFLKRVRELYDHPEMESRDILTLKDGRVFERYSHPQWIGDEIAGRVWSFRDISERVRAEEEIRRLNADLERRVQERTAELQAANEALEREIAERRRSEAAVMHLAAIVGSSDDAIMSKDLDGIITSWNAAAERIYGYSASEMIGSDISVLLPPDRPGEFSALMARIKQGARVEHYETVRVRKDGRHMDVSLTISPMRDSSGLITGASIIARDITERKRLLDQILHHAEEIRAEHERLAGIVANLDVSLIMYDAQGRVVLVNESWVSRNNIPRQAIIGRRYADLGDSPALVYAQALLDRVLQTGEPSVIREMFFPSVGQGHGVYIDGSLLPMRDSSGNITGAMGISMDVTEKVKARQEIEQQRALLRTIFETTPVGIVYYDRDLNIVDCNAAWAKFTGRPLDEVVGYSLYDLYPAVRERESVHRSVLSGETVDQDNVPFADEINGQIHYYTIRYRPVKDAQGGVIGILSTVIETTESVLARQEVERQRALLETIIDATPVGIAFFDNDLRLVNLNTSWADFVGVDPDEARGRTLYKLVPSSEARSDMHRRVLEGEPAVALNVAYTRPGAERPNYFDIQFRPMRGPSGTAQGMLIAVLDVTARHELDKQKDNFLGLASHELKTPVATIKGSAQLSRRIAERLGDERLFRMLTIIDEQSNRLTGLINELLDVTHIGSGSLTVHRDALDVVGLVGEVVGNLELAAPDFAFEVHLPPVPVYVLGDPYRLEQVLTNLVHNAIKYSGDSRTIEVSVETGESPQGEPEVIVAVRDYGVGIPAEQQARVFERFFRGRNIDTRHYDGLGLGLFISNNIVSEHGGRMWLHSTEGSGSTFYFSLPLLAED